MSEAVVKEPDIVVEFPAMTIEAMTLIVMREAGGSMIIPNNSKLAQGPIMRLTRLGYVIADYQYTSSERYSLTLNGQAQADALLSAVK